MVAMPFIHNVLIAFAALLVCWPGAAPAQQLPLRYLTQQDGLGNLSISSLAQDHDGYVWAGTDNGLFRYNGAEFRRYAQAEGLAGTQVSALLADRRQRLWVGASDGLYLRAGGRLVPVAGEDGPLPIGLSQPLADGPAASVVR